MPKENQYLKGMSPRHTMTMVKVENYVEELLKIPKLSPDYSRICKARPIGYDYKIDDLGSFRNHASKAFVVTTEKNEFVDIEQERNS